MPLEQKKMKKKPTLKQAHLLISFPPRQPSADRQRSDAILRQQRVCDI